MARNELYCQLLATLSSRPVHTMTGSTGTSAGAAMLARGVPISGTAGAPARNAIRPLPEHGGLQSYVGTWKRLAGRAAGAAIST